jgi:hypothetical protein
MNLTDDAGGRLTHGKPKVISAASDEFARWAESLCV